MRLTRTCIGPFFRCVNWHSLRSFYANLLHSKNANDVGVSHTMNIEELISNIGDEQNPALVAAELGFFTSDSLKVESLSLYEALYLKELEYSLLLKANEKQAWSYTIGVSFLLSLELLYSLALYFEENVLATSLRDKIAIALNNSGESRHHYSKDVAKEILLGSIESALLKLTSFRDTAKPDDFGPYNEEVFPWNLIAPENEFLSGKRGTNKTISPDIAVLLSDLWINYG